MLLGYSSISAFTTAFKSWYDMPPAEYRHKILGNLTPLPGLAQRPGEFADDAADRLQGLIQHPFFDGERRQETNDVRTNAAGQKDDTTVGGFGGNRRVSSRGRTLRVVVLDEFDRAHRTRDADMADAIRLCLQRLCPALDRVANGDSSSQSHLPR